MSGVRKTCTSYIEKAVQDAVSSLSCAPKDLATFLISKWSSMRRATVRAFRGMLMETEHVESQRSEISRILSLAPDVILSHEEVIVMYILVAISRLGNKRVLVTISNVAQPVSWPILGKGGQATVYRIAQGSSSYAVKEMILCGHDDIDTSTFSELASLCFLMDRDDPPLAPPVEHIMVDLEHNLVYCIMRKFDFSLSDVIHARTPRRIDVKSVA